MLVTFLCIVAILEAILKYKIAEDAPGIEPILYRENRIKIRRCSGVAGQTHRAQKKVSGFTPPPYGPL